MFFRLKDLRLEEERRELEIIEEEKRAEINAVLRIERRKQLTLMSDILNKFFEEQSNLSSNEKTFNKVRINHQNFFIHLIALVNEGKT